MSRPGDASERPAAADDGTPTPEDVSIDIDLQDDDVPRAVLYSEGDASPPTSAPADRVAAAVAGGRATPRAASQRSRLPAVASAAQVAAEKRQAHTRATTHLEKLARRRRKSPDAAWMQRPLEELPVCVIDLETTGGSDDSDEILEIGAMVLRGRHLVREFASLVDPQRPITRGAHLVHRITPDDISGAPRIEELLPWVRELTDGRVLMFHNAGFDLGFLQRALREADQEPLRQPVIDTVVLARRLLAGRCGLGALGRRLAIDLPHDHRALADARLTAQVWWELLEVLEEAGATTLGEVPGVRERPPRTRRRRRPPHRELLRLFEDAIRTQQALEITYRARRGMEPLLLQVSPQRILHNRFCRVVDIDTRVEQDIAFDRIDRCRPLP